MTAWPKHVFEQSFLAITCATDDRSASAHMCASKHVTQLQMHAHTRAWEHVPRCTCARTCAHAQTHCTLAHAHGAW
eukprot:11604616-Alexandrium_andersonii.AAC.1